MSKLCLETDQYKYRAQSVRAIVQVITNSLHRVTNYMSLNIPSSSYNSQSVSVMRFILAVVNRNHRYLHSKSDLASQIYEKGCE